MPTRQLRSLPFAATCRAVIASAALAIASSSFAQTGQDLQRAQQQNQQILQQQQQIDRLNREQEESRQRQPSGSALAPIATPQGTSSASRACTDVKELVLDGAVGLSDSDRGTLARPYLGKCLSLEDINRLIADITNFYVSRGAVTTRVYIPEQDLSGGRLLLKVLQGRVQSYSIDPEKSASLRAAFPAPGGELDLRDLEQGIDQINRLSSNSARMDIEPGDEPGLSRIVIHNDVRKRWIAGAAVDNSGTQSTGTAVYAGTLSWDNGLGLNDYFNLNLRHSQTPDSQAGHSDSVGAYLNVPWGYWNFSASLSDLQYKSLLQGQFSTFVTDGSSDSIALRADRVMYRDQTAKWSLTSGLTLKDSRNNIAGQRIDVSSARLSIIDIGGNVTATVAQTLLSLSAGASSGLGSLGAKDDDPTRPAGSPQAQFSKFTYAASVLKPFNLGEYPATFLSALNGQYSRDALYGTEQTSIGNFQTVRGFQTTNASGSSGAWLRNELGVTFPFNVLSSLDGARVRPFIGYDYGVIRHSSTLAGWTIGATLTFAHANMQLTYSKPTISPATSLRENGWLYASLAFSY